MGVAWQRSTCQAMGLKFVKPNGVSPGSGDTPLTQPDMRSIKKILGDGNCMFRALSRIVTGSQDQHSVIRAKMVQHMCDDACTYCGPPRFQRVHKRSRLCTNQKWTFLVLGVLILNCSVLHT